MRVKNNKGKNSVTFTFGERSTESKVNKLRNFKGSQIKYLNYKEKLPGGGSKIPKSVQFIFTSGYSKSTIYRRKKLTGLILPQYYYTSIQSPPDMVITPKNVLNFGADMIENYEKNYQEETDEGYDEDKENFNVKKLTIVYFY